MCFAKIPFESLLDSVLRQRHGSNLFSLVYGELEK